MSLPCPWAWVVEWGHHSASCNTQQAKHRLHRQSDSLIWELERFVYTSSCRCKQPAARANPAPAPLQFPEQTKLRQQKHFFCQQSWLLSGAPDSIATATLEWHPFFPLIISYTFTSTQRKARNKDMQRTGVRTRWCVSCWQAGTSSSNLSKMWGDYLPSSPSPSTLHEIKHTQL